MNAKAGRGVPGVHARPVAGHGPARVRVTGDQGHAEDVAQAAFARAYASWPRVRRSGDPDAHVRQIVINENRNRFRKRRVIERLTDSPPETALIDVDGAMRRGSTTSVRR